jgi:hypothetical protein
MKKLLFITLVFVSIKIAIAQDKIFTSPISFFQAKIVAVNDSEIVYIDLYDKNYSKKTIKQSRVRKVVYSKTKIVLPEIFAGSKKDLPHVEIKLLSGVKIYVGVVSEDDSTITYLDNNDWHPIIRTLKKSLIKKIKYGQKRTKGEEVRDTNRYFSFGVIPYQLFSRSSGGYISFKFKNRFSVDYRYTYTFATEHLTDLTIHSKFFYRGDNHTLALTYHGKTQGGAWSLLFGYKHWWFSNKYIPLEGEPLWSSFSEPFGSSSANIRGINFGLEYSRDLSGEKFHCVLFMNFSVTEFKGKMSGYSPDSNKFMPVYNEYDYSAEMFHASVGFKFGGRIKLKKAKENKI